MKILISFLMLLVCCTPRIENQNVEDYGTKQIGENLYLKKLLIGESDKVYLLVDKEGKLISTNTSTSYTVHVGNTSHTESNSVQW